jgi:ribosomal protein S4
MPKDDLRKIKQNAFAIMQGNFEADDTISEETRAKLIEAAQKHEEELNKHKEQLLLEAMNQEAELQRLEAEFQVQKTEFLLQFPQFEARLDKVLKRGAKARDAGVMKALKGGSSLLGELFN